MHPNSLQMIRGLSVLSVKPLLCSAPALFVCLRPLPCNWCQQVLAFVAPGRTHGVPFFYDHQLTSRSEDGRRRPSSHHRLNPISAISNSLLLSGRDSNDCTEMLKLLGASPSIGAAPYADKPKGKPSAEHREGPS